MILDFPLLALGLVLLWLPRKWMRRGKAFFRRRRRQTEPWNVSERGDPRLSFREEFSKFRNYVDLLRGAIGSLVLMGGTELPPAIQPGLGATRNAPLMVLGLQSVILLIGVLIQTARLEKHRVTFYPPIFYLAGISCGLCDIRAAAFAFSLAWSVNPALQDARGFLLAYAVLVVAFGSLFAGGRDSAVLVSGALTFLPVLLSLLFKRSLAVLVRKPKVNLGGGSGS